MEPKIMLVLGVIGHLIRLSIYKSANLCRLYGLRQLQRGQAY